MPQLEKLGIGLDVVNSTIPSGPSVESTLLVHYCHLAALVVTVYDHLINLDNEVEYIWMKKWSKSKLLFILARYLGDILLVLDCYLFLNRNADALSEVIFLFSAALFSCTIGLKFVGSGAILIIMITQVIMQFRIKALYGIKTVSIIITSLWSVQAVTLVSLSIVSIAGMEVNPISLGNASVCNCTYLPPYAYLLWIPVIAFETFLFFLSLRIAYRNYLEIGHWGGTTLIHIVLRDNFNFFFCAFAAYVITTITWVTLKLEYFTVPGSFSCAVTTVMGCRLILNLCEAYHNPPDSHGIPPVSIWAVHTSPGILFGIPDGRTTMSSRSFWQARSPLQTWTWRQPHSRIFQSLNSETSNREPQLADKPVVLPSSGFLSDTTMVKNDPADGSFEMRVFNSATNNRISPPS